jgi:hypothetical protein
VSISGLFLNEYIYCPGADPGFPVRWANLNKLRRAEGGAKNFGVFLVKNHVTIQNTLCNARSTLRAFTILRQKTHKKRLFTKVIFQTKDYQLVFVAFNAKHAELKRKSKDWLLRN